jgi:hypothetical protein
MTNAGPDLRSATVAELAARFAVAAPRMGDGLPTGSTRTQ